MISKKTFLIYCKDSAEAVDLLEVILGVEPALAGVISDLSVLEERLEDNLPDGFVIKAEKLDDEVIDIISRVRSKAPSTAIILVADLISDSEARQLYAARKEFEGTFLVDVLYQESQLLKLCEKINSAGKVFFRRFPRFETDIPAILGKLEIGNETQKGSVRNMSRGGAYIETGSSEFKRGEILELSMRIKNKSHHLHAEVVWTSDAGLGLKFMTPESIYKELVEVK